ncbi:MAG TPA: chorismate-binding protein [Gemmatimonadaceae bacterium]|nr:chorismate-binding protein [Gemmatimonadaceae bacterium]
MTGSSTPHAIVDFPSDPGRATRLTFTEPLAVCRANSIDRVVAVLDEADRAAHHGRWVVGFVSFEAAAAFDPAFERPHAPSLPLAWFAEFAAPDAPSDDGGASLHGDETGPAELTPASPVSEVQYAEAVRRIHAYIDAGDVYQVNLTVPFTAPQRTSPRAIYERMRRAQGGAYSCLIDIGDACILTASPELFFERRADRIHSRPMKGTAPRGLHPLADAAARHRLLQSEKERAENVMIVDVVRNDLGRIANIGTVHVDALCHAERYPSVWQLTSTVGAELRRGVSLAEVFGALFPPASVTGAPKIRATSIIHELETAPREIYCGAIGIVRPGGDATFNVAIRTAWTAADSGLLHLNAGGGITADSTAIGELREVGAKIVAFTQPIDPPALFETMRVERGVVVRLDRHLSRLEASAGYFGLPFDRASARRVLDETIASSERADLMRARLDLSPNGALTALARPHDPALPPGGARVVLARSPVHRGDVRLYHKCADRSCYEAAMASAPGMFDVLLWNADRQATELTRGNLVVELGGRRLTPPLDCGLLGGILRGELLERGEIEESELDLDDVRRAERLWFVNALRGWVPITLADPDPGMSDERRD